MPMPPKRPCRQQGCRNFCEYGQVYCEQHRKKEMKDYDRYQRDKESADFYHSTEWRKLSKAYREKHPFCEECQRNGKLRQARLVDHIVPIKQGGDKFAVKNLQSLCQACHERKSLVEGSRGEWRKENDD